MRREVCLDSICNPLKRQDYPKQHGEEELASLGFSPYQRGMEHKDLQITDTVIGTGKAATKGALLFCQYEGFLEDGTKFDSSYDHGRPFQFVIGSGRVIKGWDQGLMGMKEGGKRTLFVPAHLGYGEREKGLIKPHSNLIFHVELLEVRPRE